MAEEPRYPRPKVLLVDFDDEVTAAAMDAGYRVASGTLGKSFRVPQADGFVRLPSSLRVPNFAEQEIVFVQQRQQEPLEGAPTPPPETGENAVWARRRSGLIDPRPWGAVSVANQAQRILDHGGAFVIFCAPRESADLVWGRPWGHQLEVAEELDWTVWSLLPSLADIWVTTDFGLEIDTGSLPKQVAILEPFIRTARFGCTLDTPDYLKNRWFPLARNKYGSTVAAVLGPEEESRGWILLLPQVEDVSACVLALLESVLPTLTPGLFPHTDHADWLHEPPYELPAITSLQREIARVREEARAEESRLQDAIAEERAAHGWLHTLLTGTDDELVEAVARALTVLGLSDVRKLDDETEDRTEGRRREDIQIWDRSPPPARGGQGHRWTANGG